MIVDIVSSDTATEIAAEITTAINSVGLTGVNATAVGTDVQITSTEGTIVDANAATGIDAAAQRAHVADGETFTITGGGTTYTIELDSDCLLYTSPSPRDAHESRMPSSA